MYLVNIHTLRLEDFVGSGIPPYAILSHRWTEEELTFKEVFKQRANVEKKGYRKMLAACEVTKTYGLQYLWIDTCCIDKKSSADLSEAINSMFAWYRDAEICLAYLEDVGHVSDCGVAFEDSLWFTRAWTLQELLAPRIVEFFDNQWRNIGSRQSCLKALVQITGVIEGVLDLSWSMWSRPIAERMSWAANREATRVEDIAYSLIGIFNVNMPLLYGEGEKAYIRLQEELLRRTSDLSILCWGIGIYTSRVLARSPADFRQIKESELLRMRDNSPGGCKFGVTNEGLEISVKIARRDLETFGLVLGATGPWTAGGQRYVALLKRGWVPGDMEKLRIVMESPERVSSWREMRNLHILWGDEDEKNPGAEDVPRIGHAIKIRGVEGIQIVPARLRAWA